MKTLIIFAALFLGTWPALCQAAGLQIAINEISWMGNESSSNDEWIELYNNADSAANLDGWTLKTNALVINLQGIIPAKDFYLLERMDDNSAPQVKASQIYRGSLSNKGEDLALYDRSGNLADTVKAGNGWFAGSNTTKQTMERTDPNRPGEPDNWHDSRIPGGTPQQTNSKILNYQAITPSNILINEVLPSPEGPDSENEWIEIFNNNDFKVNLTGWSIKDKMGAAATYIFPAGSEITGQGWQTIKRKESRITLNNNGDALQLKDPNGRIADEMEYPAANPGQSYNRTDEGWQWSEAITPNAVNKIFNPDKEAAGKTEYPGKTAGQESAQLSTPNLKTQDGDSNKEPLGLFIKAFILALSSGIAISILKNKLKTNERSFPFLDHKT